jgi:hypothetical protein
MAYDWFAEKYWHDLENRKLIFNVHSYEVLHGFW